MANGKKGSHDKAIADYSEAIRLKPDLADAYAGRGEAYDAKGEHGKAIADLTEAIRRKPDYADAYAIRAGINWRMGGHVDEVIAVCTKAIRLKPGLAGG